MLWTHRLSDRLLPWLTYNRDPPYSQLLRLHGSPHELHPVPLARRFDDRVHQGPNRSQHPRCSRQRCDCLRKRSRLFPSLIRVTVTGQQAAFGITTFNTFWVVSGSGHPSAARSRADITMRPDSHSTLHLWSELISQMPYGAGSRRSAWPSVSPSSGTSSSSSAPYPPSSRTLRRHTACS